MSDWIYVIIGIALGVTGVWCLRRWMGFAAQKPEDYEDAAPAFDVRQHLDGPILCEGVIYGPFGRVSSRFVADFEASWSGNSGSMKERFTYDDGSIQDREWHLTVGDDGSIRATADDVVGEGSGCQTGPTVLLKYKIRLPEASGGHILDTVDWMYLTPNGTIMNRSQFRKFGVKVAELVATMRPKGAQ
ncbi:DUF3833 domain-containing protein [Roseobacter sp. YSTF-M11]|uniref:DUF3833 domain-containing protein n=1 Tax=Roseobacter insulae TaxID=2859783 RepID=A0A9X1K1F2_9RHOB|nr:DUF3833 domain-containing protein [Roseobacter insulae]MBW4706467.1 DUF3833 domain-containing protein [Roseobacter insulae]